MRRTLNEVYRICQKACEGSGAPDGLDIEAARGAVWLLARGFPALEALIEDLERTADWADACRFDKDAVSAGNLNAWGKAGALLAPSLMALLVSRANDARASDRLRVIGLSAPSYLLPAAAEYAREGWHLRLALQTAAGDQFVLHIGPSGVEVLGPPRAPMSKHLGTGPAELEATCTRSEHEPGTDDLPLKVLITPDTLAQSEARALGEGVEVASELWTRLRVYAARVLVPATDSSRRRGAGAGSQDSE